MSGTIVQRATLHNEDFIRQLNIHEGDMVWVEKGGEIIPKIIGKETSEDAANGYSLRAPDKVKGCGFTFPKECPECGAKME